MWNIYSLEPEIIAYYANALYHLRPRIPEMTLLITPYYYLWRLVIAIIKPKTSSLSKHLRRKRQTEITTLLINAYVGIYGVCVCTDDVRTYITKCKYNMWTDWMGEETLVLCIIIMTLRPNIYMRRTVFVCMFYLLRENYEVSSGVKQEWNMLLNTHRKCNIKWDARFQWDYALCC